MKSSLLGSAAFAEVESLVELEAEAMARMNRAAPKHHARIFAEAMARSIELLREKRISRDDGIEVMYRVARTFGLATGPERLVVRAEFERLGLKVAQPAPKQPTPTVTAPSIAGDP